MPLLTEAEETNPSQRHVRRARGQSSRAQGDGQNTESQGLMSSAYSPSCSSEDEESVLTSPVQPTSLVGIPHSQTTILNISNAVEDEMNQKTGNTCNPLSGRPCLHQHYFFKTFCLCVRSEWCYFSQFVAPQ